MTQDQALEAFYDALVEDDAEALYERAPCGYLSTTPQGTIVKVNQTFLTWTGHQRAELVGKRRFVDLLSPGGKLYHETHYSPLLLMQGQVREIALDIVSADGSRLPVIVNAALEKNADGSPHVVRIALFDATERREYERELLRAKTRAEISEQQARDLARTLQQTLLPPNPPQIPGLEYAAAYRPAGHGTEIGGDFYDTFQVGPDDWVVVLGDVCGKGVEAAVVTALVRHTLRAVVVGLHEPSQALKILNDVLLDHESDRFVTVALARLQRGDEGWVVTLGSGGHPPALLVGSDGTTSSRSGRGPLVGVLQQPVFEDVEVPLAPGETLVLYTDGVTEGRRDGVMYGEGRLRAALETSGPTAAEKVDHLLEDVLAFQAQTPRDDVAVVAVRVPTETMG